MDRTAKGAYALTMHFDPILEPATLLRRYKRFLADVVLSDGTETTVHCPNPCSMVGAAPEGARCWGSRSPNKARKLPLTLEIVECPGPDGHALVGINTNAPNKLAVEAISQGIITELPHDAPLKREVRYGEEKSRIDILLDTPKPTYVEVKNCHLLRRDDGVTEFPDCVTARGLKHLRELMGVKAAGHRAVLLFIVQREDAVALAPADDLDPAYGEGLRAAADAGVEILAYRCSVAPEGIHVRESIPIELGLHHQ